MDKLRIKILSIKYIFKSGRKSRLESVNEFPKEFFYGYYDFFKRGINIDLIEEVDLGISKKNNLLKRVLNKFSKLLMDFPIIHSIKLLNKKNYQLLNESSIIIATTKSIGLSLGLLKFLKIIKKPVIFFVMGLFPTESNILKRNFYNLLLNDINLVAISKNEKKYLESQLPKKKVLYIPFGIDKDFWQPKSNNLNNQSYVLAIGNDYNRDWITLINAWEDYYPELLIITNHPIKTSKNNILIKNGSWGDEYLSDNEIKNLYLNALFVIIPLKQTIQPSGQSCCLQAMACGKPVIMTRIKGAWDDNLIKNKKTLLLVNPESIEELQKSILDLLKNKKLKKELSKNGRKLVEDHFNTFIMTNHLEKIIRDLTFDNV